MAEELLEQGGWILDLAHPGYVSRMKQSPDKSDYSDAQMLADAVCVGYLPKVWLAPTEIREFRQLVRYRQQLINERRSSKRTPWSTFLKAHWDSMAAMDLFTVEAWTTGGLVRYYVLFFIKLSSRHVDVAGITPHSHSNWIKQVARNSTGQVDGFLLGIRYLIMDRDAIFTEEFRNYLKQEGVKSVRLPPRSPNLNAYAERFVRTIKESCLDRMIFFGQRTLWKAINEFVEFYHYERNHQGLGNRLIDPPEELGATGGSVTC